MKYIAQFDHPEGYKTILRDSFNENTYYGLDIFDCRYLRIIQAKFGCVNSLHTIPDRVKMEMAPYNWNNELKKFVLDENHRLIVQVNRLESMIISHSFDLN